MHKYVYLFKEGNASMRNLLGGKGAGLAEMTILAFQFLKVLQLLLKHVHYIMILVKLYLTILSRKFTKL